MAETYGRQQVSTRRDWLQRSMLPRLASSPAVCTVSWMVTRVLVLAAGVVLVGNFTLWEVHLYEEWGTMFASRSDFADTRWQYPPLVVPVLVVLASTGLMPAAFVAVALAADLTIFALLLRRSMAGAHWLGPWGWVSAAIVLGPTLWAKLDIISAAFAVAAILAAGRPWRAGSLAGLGALFKVWPALTVVALPRRDASRGVAALGVTVLIGWALLVSAWPGSQVFFTNQADRRLQVESVAAWPFLVAGTLGADVRVESRYGAFELVMASSDAVAVACGITTVIGLAGVAWLWLSGRLATLAPAEAVLLAVLVSLITSRVLSPQFNTWTIAVGCVVLLQVGIGGLPIVGLIFASSTATILLQVAGGVAADPWSPAAVALHSARLMCAIAATALLIWRLKQSRKLNRPQM